MVEHCFRKAEMWVRFPPSAPLKRPTKAGLFNLEECPSLPCLMRSARFPPFETIDPHVDKSLTFHVPFAIIDV